MDVGISTDIPYVLLVYKSQCIRSHKDISSGCKWIVVIPNSSLNLMLSEYSLWKWFARHTLANFLKTKLVILKVKILEEQYELGSVNCE